MNSYELPKLLTEEQQRALLAAVVATSGDPIVTKTLQGIVTSWNASAESMFGYSADEMIGRSIRTIIPDDRQHEEDLILSRIAAGEHVAHFETVRITKGRREVEVSVSISPLLDSTGNVVGASKIIRDITEKKRVERQIQTLSQEVSHRARNLLTIVQSIIRQTASAGDPATLAGRLLDRVAALAATYDLMKADGAYGAELGKLLEGQLAHFRDLFGSRIHMSGPPLILNRVAAQNIGMSIHELSTNACKYGALSVQGEIAIRWSVDADGPEPTFEIEWKESGGPEVAPPTRRGFGWQVTDALAGPTLGGQSKTRYEPTGVAWTLSAPLAKVSVATE